MVQAVTNFPTPKLADDVRSFVGLAGFHGDFIHGFASIPRPFINLLKKGEAFVWNSEQQDAFDPLKHTLTMAPVLKFPNFKEPFTQETDACRCSPHVDP